MAQIREGAYGDFWKKNSPFASFKEVMNPATRVWMYLDDDKLIQGPFTSLEMD